MSGEWDVGIGQMGRGRQLLEWDTGTRGFITRFSLLFYKLGIFQIKSQNKQTAWFAPSYFLILFSPAPYLKWQMFLSFFGD